MIKSMTGFGRVAFHDTDVMITVEVKTLNSKFFDLSLRLPRLFSEKELELRNIIADKLERGKVALSIDYLPSGNEQLQQAYNEDLFAAYYTELKKLADKVISPTHDGLFQLALNSPGVILDAAVDKMNESHWEKIRQLVTEALHACDSFRKTEGRNLGDKLNTYVESLYDSLARIEQLDPARVGKIRGRITDNIQSFFGEAGIDMNRLEQELIFYIEKLDIHEERVRLKSHLDHFKHTLDETQSNGKKLGFISQEIGREINTIGSKANDAEIQRLVVSLKEELEKIKEQLNNVL